MLKGNKRILDVLLLGTVVLSTMLASCAPAATPTPKPEATAVPAKPIKIGVPVLLTGGGAYLYGETLANAAKLAAKEINAAGGVLGRPLEIVLMDDAGDPKQGVSVAHAYCDDEEVVALYAHPFSGVTIPALPVYDECGMPVVVHGTNPRITELGHSNAFQLTPNDFIAGQAAADYVYEELGIKKVAVLHNKTMWGEGVARVFRSRCEDLGMEVTSFSGVDADEVDFRPVLTKVKGENPEALYFGGYTEIALMRKQMVGLGMDQMYIAAEATSSEYIDAVGEAGVGTLTASAAPPLFRPEMEAYAKAYQAEYGKPSEAWCPYYYTAIFVIADAIERAGSATREAILEALPGTDISAIMYPSGLQWDSKGRVKKPVMFVQELKSNLEYELVYLWEGKPPYETMGDEAYSKMIEEIMK